ncbi:hypothetical protein [Microbacterium deminutum]|uniref:hypothetical protein n=1 Tax=Microbacterium deminutum TaxID=344164 RepID=UPI0031D29EF6
MKGPPDAEPGPDVVFIGTVLQTASSSVAEVEPAADTVVVRVDQVVSGAPAFHDHLGEPITVALPEGVEVAEGDVHVFGAIAWIFGTGLAVRATSVGDAAALAAALDADDHRSVDARTQARIANAELVISGIVRQVSHVPNADGRPISEHDPLWQDAVVDVHGQLGHGAGDAPEKVIVRFASSRDIRWYQSPKFSVGDRGVFILGVPPAAALTDAAVDLPDGVYLVVDPDDFRPAEDAQTLLAEIDERGGEQ